METCVTPSPAPLTTSWKLNWSFGLGKVFATWKETCVSPPSRRYGHGKVKLS